MKKYSRIIALLLAVALVLPGAGLAAKAEESANKVTRLSGANRYETAVEVSKEAYTTAKTVILASGESSVDALTGTSLAGKLDAPILYTTKGELHAATKAQLKALGAETVHLLGGAGVISEAVETELEGLGYTVGRISGQNRAETAVEVARKLGATHTRAYLVTDGLKTALADALAIAPVSHMLEAPVFLTGQAGLTPATKAALEEFGVTHVTIIGGEVAVSTAVETELKSLVTVNRIKGGTRAETAVKIAEELFTTAPTKAVLANGWKNDLVDALAGGYLGGKMVAPILYATSAGALEAATQEYLDTTFTDVYVLGGTGVVTTAAEEAALEAISPLEVKSVSAITDIVFDDTADQVLKFTVNEGREVTLAELDEAGYTVEFLADEKVLEDSGSQFKNADGKVIAGSFGSITSFKYQVVITPEEGDAIESAYKTVKVQTADDWASVESAALVLEGTTDAVKASVIVVDEEILLAPTSVTQNNGKKVDLDAPYGDDNDWFIDGWENLDSVKSSNTAVATVAIDGTEIVITGISPGKSTITVKLDNKFEFTYKVEVKEDAREATTATADTVKITQAGLPVDVEVTILDQYGDPVDDGETYYTVAPLNAAKDGVLFTQDSGTTNEKGIVELEVDLSTAKDEKTGVYTFNVSSVDPNGIVARVASLKASIGTFKVDYTKAAEVETYALQVDSASLSKDNVIDAYDDKDDAIELRFVGLDKDKNVAAIAELGAVAGTIGFDAADEFTVEITGDTDAADLAVAASGSNLIKLTAVGDKTGTVKVVVKKGLLTVATYTVTVKDGTPVLTGLKLATDAKVEVAAGGTFDLNDAAIKALVEVLGKDGLKLKYSGGVLFGVKDGDNTIGDLEVISSDESVFGVAANSGNTLVEVKAKSGLEADDTADMILRLEQNGKIVKTVTIPVTIK